MATLITIDQDPDSAGDGPSSTRSPGVTWRQAAQAALDRGVTDALLLDGGGSSTLVAQLAAPALSEIPGIPGYGEPSRVTVVNTPRDDGNFPEGAFTQRLVGNALLFTGLVPPTPTPPAPPTPTASPSLAATGASPWPATIAGALILLSGAATLAVRRHVTPTSRRRW